MSAKTPSIPSRTNSLWGGSKRMNSHKYILTFQTKDMLILVKSITPPILARRGHTFTTVARRRGRRLRLRARREPAA